MVNDSFTDRFGQKERTGVGGRSRPSKGDYDQDSSERVRQRLLNELSALRGHHESLQRQRDDPHISSFDPATFDPNMFGNNAGRTEKGEGEGWGQLGDGDKDAIEALFASDDFAEMFNAGAGHVSRLQPLAQPPELRNRGDSRPKKNPQLSPVCHMCARQLAPSDIAAYVSKTFDPTKPSRRRQPK
jgi:hypothetical protein